MNRRLIGCIECGKYVQARLTNGKEIYPHRQDLSDIPYWKCDTCGNYVGCHYKSRTPTKPLGIIATKSIYRFRKRIHDRLDPLWQAELITRGQAYKYLSKHLGYEYHTGMIARIEEAKKVYQ
jgi:hypothetical protein